MSLFVGRSNQTRLVFLRILIVAVIGTLLATRVRPNAVWAVLSSVSLSGLIPVFLLSCAWFVIRIWKWRVLLRALTVPASLATTVLSFSRGNVLGLVTPMQLGDLARATLISQGHKGTAALLVIGDRALDLVALVVLASAGMGLRTPEMLVGLLGVLGVVGLVVAKHRTLGGAILRILKTARLSEFQVSAAIERCSYARWDRRVLLSLVTMSLVTYVVVIAQYHLVLTLISPGYDMRALVFCPVLMLARAVPFTFGGLGAREGVALALLPLYGIPDSAAVAASLLMYPANLLIPLIGALVSLCRRRSVREERAT
jgi:uncharacterized membrane protein YbhN (UPF0104 family)